MVKGKQMEGGRREHQCVLLYLFMSAVMASLILLSWLKLQGHANTLVTLQVLIYIHTNSVFLVGGADISAWCLTYHTIPPPHSLPTSFPSGNHSNNDHQQGWAVSIIHPCHCGCLVCVNSQGV